MRKRPTRTSYTNKYIPTLVSVTNPTQTHTVNLFGREVTVTFKATSYEWDWGDDTPHTTTAYQGIAFEKSTDPNATRTITLTTTWAGTATNPFTGETQTINSLVTTKETTGPFPPGPPHHLKHRHLGRKTRPLKHHQAVHAPGTTHAPANAAGPRTQRCAAPERSTGEGTPAS